jgi:hypothetical protein
MKTQKTFNRRIDVAPEGGVLAKLGFYTSPVQKVVRKWRGKIDAETLENYFRRVAMSVIHDKTSLEIGFVWPHHWPVIWELGTAVTKVMQDDKSLDKWLLKLPLSVATNGKWDSWNEIAVQIGRLTNRKEASLSATLKTRAKRLKLLTPAALASEFMTVTKFGLKM